MYNVAICDDDMHCAKTMYKILESEFISQDFECEIISVTDKQEEILELVKNHKIDILFLDIDFKNDGKNGIDFANDLREFDNSFCLVFLSAHVRYMPLSFTSKTFDFLVKPVHKSVISLLIERIKKDFERSSKKLLSLNKNLKIKIDTITFIEKDGNKCNIHTSNTIVPIVITLDSLLAELPGQFARCHRSIIFNLNRVSLFNKKKNVIIFDNGETCPCSSNFYIEKEG